MVGPRVSGELARTGTLAVLFTIAGIMAYIWFRFEWQFGVGAVATLVHDAILTVGFFAATQIDFNLSSIAAILTIIGYSLNDTVVIFDRIREILRRYKQMPISDVIDLATNQTLARTIMTSLTLLLALRSLYFFGGEVIRSFTAAMIWGVFVATASSIFIGGPILIYFNLRPRPAAGRSRRDQAKAEAGPASRRRWRRGIVIRAAHFPGRAPIEAYGNGGFRFAGMSHRGSILCLPSGIYGWDAPPPRRIDVASLAQVFAEAERDRDSADRHRARSCARCRRRCASAAASAAIVAEPMATGAAVRTFNVLLAEERAVAAALVAVD